MGIAQQIKAVNERALRLYEQAASKSISPELLESALKDLYLVLEELHTADEEIRQQHIELSATRARVEEERQRYRLLFELAPDAYLVTDHKGLIHRVNRAATTLFSKSKEALVGKPLIVFIDVADHSQVLTQLAFPHYQPDWRITLADKTAPPNVAFYFQPPYSPELNPIKQLWALLKGRLANHLWVDLDELQQVLS